MKKITTPGAAGHGLEPMTRPPVVTGTRGKTTTQPERAKIMATKSQRQAALSQMGAYVRNAYQVSVVAGAAGNRTLSRRAWRQFEQLRDRVQALGYVVNIPAGALSLPILVDPAGEIVDNGEIYHQ